MVLTMRTNLSAKKSSGIDITPDRFAFGVATIPNFMAATSEDIVKMLRQRRMIASGSIIEELCNHHDPEKLLDLGHSVDFDKGFLTKEILNKMLKLLPQDENETSISKPTATFDRHCCRPR